MNKFLQGALITVVSLISIIIPTSIALGAYSQYGLPGIYNASNFTLNSGEGSAISTDVNGRVKISPSSALTSLTVTNFTTTDLTATRVTSTAITSTRMTMTEGHFTNNAAVYFNANGGGILVNGGYLFAVQGLYVQGTATFRGNLANDTSAALSILGGTSGITNFTTKVGINSSSPIGALGLNSGTGATTTVFLDSTSTKGACVVIKDSDGSGYTYLTANNGAGTFSTTNCR